MTEIPIWPGSSSFSPGETPFGLFDTDANFQTDADTQLLILNYKM